jgi:hypothetical protein
VKAHTYRPCRGVEKTARCDNLLGVTDVTPSPKRGKTQLNVLVRTSNRCDKRKLGVTNPNLLGVTRHRSGFVTATAVINGPYAERLRMSNKKIKAIWLSLERVAELKGCSTRTVWRYINTNLIQTYKHLIKVGQRMVYKTFVLTDPEMLQLELSVCQAMNLEPNEIMETAIEIDGKPVNSALIWTYKVSQGGQDGIL